MAAPRPPPDCSCYHFPMNDSPLSEGPLHYRAKHPSGTTCEPTLAAALAEIADNGRIACAAALELAERLGVSPAEVGRAADLLEYRIVRCQLGLFGYEPEKRVVRPAEQVSDGLRERLAHAAPGGRIDCASLWEIADTMGLDKMTVSAACERLGLKITRCRIGAF